MREMNQKASSPSEDRLNHCMYTSTMWLIKMNPLFQSVLGDSITLYTNQKNWIFVGR